MSLIRSFATVSLLTAASRVLGFVRDILIASFLGAGPVADAFFVAFKLPNFLRRLFAEGAFNAAFIPMFSGMLATDGRDHAKRFANESFAALLLVLSVLTVLAEIFMPSIISVLAPGFRHNPEQLALTVELSRVTFPYLLMISLAAMLTGVLNSMERFAPGAAAPIMLNLCLITVLVALRDYFPSTAHALAWGVAVAGVMQASWLYYSSYKAGMAPTLIRPRYSKAIRKLLLLMAPVAIGAGVAQINLLVDIMLASTLPNAVSYLYFADRVNQLPLGMIGVAIGTAVLPMLSKQWQSGNHDDARTTQNRALELAFVFCLPASVALMLIAEPIVHTLFVHGAFSTQDGNNTAPTLMAYAAGLPAMIAVKVFASAFFANKDTRTPVIIGVICLITNVVLNLILMRYYAHVGLAMATSIAGWLNAVLLWVFLVRRDMFIADARLISRSFKLVLSSLAMGAVLMGLWAVLHPYFGDTLSERIAVLAALILPGMMVYAGMVLLTGASSITELKQMTRRRRA